MIDEKLDAELTKIAAFFKALHLTHDTRVLAAAMLGYTGYLYNLLLASKAVTSEHVTELYATAHSNALEAWVGKAPRVVQKDGDDMGTLN